MSWVRLQPRYQELLRRRGLQSARDFLTLAGVILCGHPDRHVLHLEDDSIPFGLFLKKEHRVPWSERLASWRAGFGFASRSAREARQLEWLREAGIECPEVLAVGEDAGQAFLLLREHARAQDLRAILAVEQDGTRRRELARTLATALAKMHTAGVAHPDLYGKHILVNREGNYRLCFVDWQRSQLPRALTWQERLYNLAMLDASLAGPLASSSERLLVLRTYLGELAKQSAVRDGATASLRRSLRFIQARSGQLRKGSRVRESRQPPLRQGQQNLIWLDGERVCVTQQLRREFGPHMAGLLKKAQLAPTQLVEAMPIAVEAGRSLRLVRRRSSRFWHWLWARLRRRTLVSPELEQAAHIFRLERHGIAPPRLLAVGQQFSPPWRSVSFLLTEPPGKWEPLSDFLTWASRRHRWQALRLTGELLQRLHEAGFRVSSLDVLGVHVDDTEDPKVVLTGVESLRRARRGFELDLQSALKKLQGYCSRTELFRFLLAYHEALSHTRGEGDPARTKELPAEHPRKVAA